MGNKIFSRDTIKVKSDLREWLSINNGIKILNQNT